MSKSIQEVLLETFGGKLPEYYNNLTNQMQDHVEEFMSQKKQFMSGEKRGSNFVGAVMAKKQKDVVLSS